MIKSAVMWGILGGIAAGFLAIIFCIAAAVVAFTRQTRVEIPSLLTVWTEGDPNNPELLFQPSYLGFFELVLGCMIGAAVLAFVLTSRRTGTSTGPL